MTRAKILMSTLLALIFLAVQVVAVGAAPATQETTPIAGTVESITLETDAETTTTVVVTLTDELGGTLKRSDSVSKMQLPWDLLIDDGTIHRRMQLVTPVEIDPALVIPEATEDTEEEAQHPVGSALANFFSDLLGVDYETVMEYHAEGVGFGVIAQALWMTNALEGDSDTFAAILEAKQNERLLEKSHCRTEARPQNWGQFRKAVMHDRDKSKENLGAIMSGRADDGQDEEPRATETATVIAMAMATVPTMPATRAITATVLTKTKIKVTTVKTTITETTKTRIKVKVTTISFTKNRRLIAAGSLFAGCLIGVWGVVDGLRPSTTPHFSLRKYA
jgi:hypothetical protein